MVMAHILLVARASAARDALAASLRAQGHVVAVADEARHGALALAEPGIELVVLDVTLPELSVAALRGVLAAGEAVVPDSLDDAERRHISLVLRHTGGNRRQAAMVLGISRSTLLNKIRKYRIVSPRA